MVQFTYGEFIRDQLWESPRGLSQADLFIALREQPFYGRMKYHSFNRWFHMLKQLGYVRRLKRRARSRQKYTRALGVLVEDKTFYSLTEEGREADDSDWRNPAAALYPRESGYWQRYYRPTGRPRGRPALTLEERRERRERRRITEVRTPLQMVVREISPGVVEVVSPEPTEPIEPIETTRAVVLPREPVREPARIVRMTVADRMRARLRTVGAELGKYREQAMTVAELKIISNTLNEIEDTISEAVEKAEDRKEKPVWLDDLRKMGDRVENTIGYLADIAEALKTRNRADYLRALEELMGCCE